MSKDINQQHAVQSTMRENTGISNMLCQKTYKNPHHNENTPMYLTFLQPEKEKIPAYLLAFLLTSLGESLCDDRERELSLWDRSERSERSDFGDGDFALLLPLLRDGLGEALCRLFLCKESK